MRIRVGMIGRSNAWEELLGMEGVPTAPVDPFKDRPAGFSAVVVCRPVTRDEAAYLREYLRSGGAVMAYAGYCAGVVNTTENPLHIRYLCPDENSLLHGLALIDLETAGVPAREANCLRTNENLFAVFAGEMQGGWGVITPFDPGAVFEDFRAAERYFLARPERLPSERVSRVAKGEILHFLHSALEYLHHVRRIPYAHLGRFPAGVASVFSLRIDTDGGTRGEIDEAYAVAREFGMGFSWFLDVKSHEPWLNRFAGMEHQEIGLHCYDHRVFLDSARDAGNIRAGRRTMKEAGLPADSFSAPFGFWSPDLGRAIDEEGFHYSSEFSWAYDTLPHRPACGVVRFRTLQVPVHPVSIGSLRKAGYSSSQMSQYYADVIARKLSRSEPLFFYHHPGHQEWDVVRALAADVAQRDLPSMTLMAYASWWARRCGSDPAIDVDEREVRVRARSPHDDIALRVSRHGGEEAYLGLTSTAVLHSIPWRAAPEWRLPRDIKRTREFDLRGEIGRQFTRLQRRFL